MLHTNERCAAGGTADDTTEPVLTVVAWAGMIAPAGLDFCHAGLNGIPQVFIDDRLVLSANGQNVRVIIVAAAAALYAVLLLAMRMLTRGEIEQMPAGEKLYALITKIGFYR